MRIRSMTLRLFGRFRVALQGVVIFALFFVLLPVWASVVQAATGERQLSLSLPEIVVESPDIGRIVAQRVRPIPPLQLGVRIPRIFPHIEMPRINPLSRPFPLERKPDLALTDVGSSFSRFFGDEDKIFESGLAYLKKNSPVEALSFFKQSMESTDSARLKAAAQYWAAESLIRLGRFGEARNMRLALLTAGAGAAESYRYAARYALAARDCREGALNECLKWLVDGSWKAGDFAYEEARFLEAWVSIRKSEQGKALDILSKLLSGGRRNSPRVQVSAGHLYFAAGEYEKARNVYSNFEPIRAPNKKGAGVEGEALNGLGWSHLFLGKTKKAGLVFAQFLKRHPNHPQVFSAKVGRLAVRIEGGGEKARRALNKFIKKYSTSEHIGPLQLQMAWALFKKRKFNLAQKLAASVSDKHALGQIYRLGRIIEGLSLYHLDKIRAAYGVLRTGAESPPIGGPAHLAESQAARSAAMATAFAAFRLKDFEGAQTVLRHWAFHASAVSDGRADSEAALWYGEAAFEAGNLKQARQAFGRVTKNEGQWYRAQAGLAWIHYRKLEWRQAAALFDRVFAAKPLGPLAAEALARAGEARFNLGDYVGALKAFELVEKEFAGGAVAGEALLEKGKLLFRRNRLVEAGESFDQY
ncbi:MAG: tetratricopeptide repeat protein, partial [Nitrospinaceae bacterium]|nr:tetratricopeptide repeat protein [Nitrospinaceae bacterium]